MRTEAASQSGGVFPKINTHLQQRGTIAGLEASKLFPIGDRVLIRRFPEVTVTVGGIVIPEEARPQALKGLVIAVGPGKEDREGNWWRTQLKPGQVVAFTASVDMPYGDLVHDGDYIMMREADVLGVLVGEPLPKGWK